MILRLIASALRRQDWFQVIIEIFIVVIGIFLGLQVQDWDTERQNRVKENTYLNRLHNEVTQGLNFSQSNFNILILLEEFQITERLLIEIAEVFDGTDTETILDHEYCLAVVTSHIYNGLTSSLPTLTELLASG
jgi:hypothetical protein